MQIVMIVCCEMSCLTHKLNAWVAFVEFFLCKNEFQLGRWPLEGYRWEWVRLYSDFLRWSLIPPPKNVEVKHITCMYSIAG